MELLSQLDLPEAFIYPDNFLHIINLGLIDLQPWNIMGGEILKIRYKGLKSRYKNRVLIPFARRLDNDDIACWDIDFPNKIFIIHDYASPGWEGKDDFESIWDWLKNVIDDMRLNFD